MDIRYLNKIFTKKEWINLNKTLLIKKINFISLQKSQEELYNKLYKDNIRLVYFKEREYCQKLSDNFPIYFIKGKKISNEKPIVAIVGSRKATNEGKIIAQDISEILTKKKFSIISDLSYGISFTAQKAAIENRGNNIIVFPSQAGKIYPQYYQDYINKNSDSSTLIWLFPPNYRDSRIYLSEFKTVNNLISLLADIIIFIEGTKYSGTRSLINSAADYGKEILIWGKKRNCPQGELAQILIENGCKPFYSIDNILKYFGLYEKKITSDSNIKTRIIQLLDEPTPITILLEKFEYSPGYILQIILDMELEGLIQRIEGALIKKRFV